MISQHKLFPKHIYWRSKLYRVYITRKIPEAGLRLLKDHGFELDIWPGDLPPSKEELKRGISQADAMISLLTDKIDEEVISNARNLKVIANYAVGYDNIDLEAATKAGIVVTNTPDVLTETTADLAWALMLSVARRLIEGVSYVKDGKWRTWEPQLLLGQDVYGATLGIVGMGRIGQAVARRAIGFQMKVLYTSRSEKTGIDAQKVSLDELLAQSDFISLHAPLTKETRHMINKSTLRRMKPTAILINTARGPLVDTAALVEALREGQIAGAGLDVTDPEPLPRDHPLLYLPNCIVVPHIGSASQRTRDLMSEIAARNVIAVLEGSQAPNQVNILGS